MITVYDVTEHGVQGFGSLDNVVIKQNGLAIQITAQLGFAVTSTEELPKIDLGVLPIGRYTVTYAATNTSLPDLHKAALTFTVSEEGLVTAVEYYNAKLDHYFITAFADEIAKLDDGEIAGWSRTAQAFHVLPADAMPSNANPVCRFYGLPQAGLDSHFYSDQIDECDAVKKNWPTQWLEESSAVFGTPFIRPGVTVCRPLYRLYNNRPDANHRYTVDEAIRDAMIARGWVVEGRYVQLPNGVPSSTAYAMCVPD